MTKKEGLIILIVEDEKSLQTLYKIILERAGAKVLTATTVQRGIGIFFTNKEDIDAIMLDGMLPDGSSEPLVRKIVASGFGGIIMATSGTINSKLMAAGCNLDKPKPLSKKDILSVLD